MTIDISMQLCFNNKQTLPCAFRRNAYDSVRIFKGSAHMSLATQFLSASLYEQALGVAIAVGCLIGLVSGAWLRVSPTWRTEMCLTIFVIATALATVAVKHLVARGMFVPHVLMLEFQLEILSVIAMAVFGYCGGYALSACIAGPRRATR